MSNQNIAVIVCLAIINGIFSPAFIAVFALHGIWYPFFLPASLPLVLVLSSLILSTLTLMIGGVPAALYERLAGGGVASTVSGIVWLGSVLLLTLPALPNAMRALGFGN